MSAAWRMLQVSLRSALAIVLLGVVGWTLYWATTTFIRFLVSLDQPLIVAILAASTTIVTSTLTIVIGRILERKKEADAHFRERKYEQYDEMLKMVNSFTSKPAQDIPDDAFVKQLNDWQWRLILFAGPRAIRSYVDWMADLKLGIPRIRTILLMEAFFKSLRSDLGISNFGLRNGDFAHVMLRHGSLFVAMAKKNPNMTLAELSEMEKAIETIDGRPRGAARLGE
jgi:hypothetical protein